MKAEIEALLHAAAHARLEGRSDAARGAATKAVELCRLEREDSALFQALRALGQYERDLHNYAAALAPYEEAVKLARAAGEPCVLAHAIRHLADLLQELDLPEDAGGCFREALALYRASNEPPPLDLANALRPFALWCEQRGEMKEASSAWREARSLYAQLGLEAGVAEADEHLAALG